MIAHDNQTTFSISTGNASFTQVRRFMHVHLQPVLRWHEKRDKHAVIRADKGVQKYPGGCEFRLIIGSDHLEPVEMAIIECAECFGKVSTTAAACPHCGAPVDIRMNAGGADAPAVTVKTPRQSDGDDGTGAGEMAAHHRTKRGQLDLISSSLAAAGTGARVVLDRSSVAATDLHSPTIPECDIPQNVVAIPAPKQGAAMERVDVRSTIPGKATRIGGTDGEAPHTRAGHFKWFVALDDGEWKPILACSVAGFAISSLICAAILFKWPGAITFSIYSTMTVTSVLMGALIAFAEEQRDKMALFGRLVGRFADLAVAIFRGCILGAIIALVITMVIVLMFSINIDPVSVLKIIGLGGSILGIANGMRHFGKPPFIYPPTEVDFWIDRLCSDHGTIRRDAAYHLSTLLGKFREKAEYALPSIRPISSALAHAMQDYDPVVRRLAIDCIVECLPVYTGDATEDILRFTNDVDDYNRASASSNVYRMIMRRSLPPASIAVLIGGLTNGLSLEREPTVRRNIASNLQLLAWQTEALPPGTAEEIVSCLRLQLENEASKELIVELRKWIDELDATSGHLDRTY